MEWLDVGLLMVNGGLVMLEKGVRRTLEMAERTRTTRNL